MYAGDGAASFARSAGFEPAGAEEMISAAARERLAEVLRRGSPSSWAGGTVGAVARDARGSVAAATSTGGTVGKRHGRVGDSPVIGAGTYADDRTGAISATGEGEGILRVHLAASVLAQLRCGSPEAAVRSAIETLSERTGKTGGVILVTADGALAFARSTATMSWAAAWEGADIVGGY